MLIVVLMLCSFAVATAEFVLVGLLPEIAADLTVSVPAAGQLVTVYMLVVTVGGPVATVLTRRLPRRSLLAATMALATAAAALSPRRAPTACCSSPGSARRSRRRCSWPSPRRSRWPPRPAARQTAAVARVFAGSPSPR